VQAGRPSRATVSFKRERDGERAAARYIPGQSPRKDGLSFAINCASFAGAALEASCSVIEGPFTGALNRKIG